jgi:probable selenium-dependent hydroxylase accessory protein YqeC
MNPVGDGTERGEPSSALASMKDEPYESGLKYALGLGEREVISLVGAGGKTCLMFLLAKQLRESGYRVVSSTTTKIFEPGPNETPYVSLGETQELILARIDQYGHVTVVSQKVPQGKLAGITPRQVEALWESARIDYLVVEADGAARRPLKAPESYEPVIPPCTGVVVGVVGADAFGALLDENTVFRSAIFSRLTGLPLATRLTYESIALAFTHKEGILKGTPERARIVLFVNKVDLEGGLRKGREFARVILDSADPMVDRVILGHLRRDPPAVEVIFR